MSIRTLVVTNCASTSRSVADVIYSKPEFELLANCNDSSEALLWMKELRPDLLLIDVELPGMDGFELKDAIGSEAPEVIFLGTSTQHALRAFELGAIDLVCKPVTKERLVQALIRARQYVRECPVEANIPPSGLSRLLLRSSGRLIFLEQHEVAWIEANDNYVVFHTAGERHTVRMTMNKIESLLRADLFVRIHRSVIVNVEHVRELRPVAHGDYAVSLRDGTHLTLTRSYRRHAHEFVPSWQL